MPITFLRPTKGSTATSQPILRPDIPRPPHYSKSSSSSLPTLTTLPTYPSYTSWSHPSTVSAQSGQDPSQTPIHSQDVLEDDILQDDDDFLEDAWNNDIPQEPEEDAWTSTTQRRPSTHPTTPSPPPFKPFVPTFTPQITLQDDEEDLDGGAMLARLMKMNEALREGRTTDNTGDSAAKVGHSATAFRHPSTPAGQQGDIDEGPKTAEERKQMAVRYLEDLCRSFFQQTSTSLQTVYARQREKANKKKSKSTQNPNKRRKGNEENSQSQSQSQGVSQEVSKDEDGQPVKKMRRKRSSQGSSQESLPEIVISTKNRKTGMDQIISWPENPATFDEEEKETAVVKMTRVLAVASMLHAAVLDGVPTTKRDIYYSNVSLFKHQRVVDKIIDDMIASAGLKRADFNVCASAKGLVASKILRIFLKTGEELSISASLAALIPPMERIERIEMAEPLSFILIVEKDAVFNTLCGARLLEEEEMGHGILITGKGFPDLSTLQLVSWLAKHHPGVGIYALVDGDPHGIDILSTYQFGSQASKHSHDYTGLSLKCRLTWIGVSVSELAQMGVGMNDLLPLSDRDWTKAVAMLRNRPDLPMPWKRELSDMLHVNRKAEIEFLQGVTVDQGGHGAYSSRNKLVDYVINRVVR